VLDYFDAYLLGLTATPANHTYGFFNQNVVMEYPHERAVADGVNCDYEVYRIRTSITAAGSTIESMPGTMVGYLRCRKNALNNEDCERYLRPSAPMPWQGIQTSGVLPMVACEYGEGHHDRVRQAAADSDELRSRVGRGKGCRRSATPGPLCSAH